MVEMRADPIPVTYIIKKYGIKCTGYIKQLKYSVVFSLTAGRMHSLVVLWQRVMV
jgi:hypothetical protein